jgi:hypothetical protein
VRDALRDFAKVEGMPDDGPSNLMAVNRRLQLGDTGKYGVPDNRLRHKFVLETSLTMKGWHTPQIRAWNNDGPSLIVRPTKLGGAYALPPNPRKLARKMSALSEKLMNFAGSVSAATDAPDAYPDFRVELSGDMETAYQINRQTVLDDWAEVRRLIKRDLDKVAIIDECLGIAFSAFDAGNKDLGRAKMFEIYNLGLRKLR